MFAKGVRYCLVLLILMAGTQSVFAQATGTIYGTVHDPSNAAVPGATVTVTNTGTGDLRTVTADAAGQFTATQLPVGLYRVRVEKEGFNPFVQENITLDANTSIQVPAALQMKTATQAVTVSAGASMVQAEQTSLVQIVDQRRIEDLPLNGRNVLQLMAINNGTSFSNTLEGGVIVETQTFGNGAYAIPVSVNGSRPNQTNYLLDEQDNNDGFENITEPFPNPDAIQEFSMQTSTFDAQYGRGIGGVVNIVTRSGNNQVHGTAFDFLRNYDLNSRNFFTGLDSLKRNQFGGSLGGPLIRNKLFLFGSYQGTRQSSATPSALTLAPDAAMKTGNLSEFLGANGQGVVLDPTNGQPFSGNIIPASRWDPVSTKLLNYLPAANQPNRLYQYSTPAAIFHDDQVILRGDENISEKQRLFIRYFFLNMNIPWGSIPNNLYYIALGQKGIIQSVSINHNYTFSPRFFNEIGLSYHRETPQAVPPPGQLSYTALGANVLTPNDPSLILGINNLNGFMWNGLGYFTSQETYELNDDLSFVTGKQTIRLGGEVKKYRNDIVSYYLSGGWAQFSGSLTSLPGKGNAANAWAEFLLGDLSSWQQQSYWSERLYNWYYSLYLQDDVRLTTKLTLNAGLRWEPRPYFTEINNKGATYIPGVQSTRYPHAPLGLLFNGDPQVGDTAVAARWNNVAPRLGLAYQVAPRTVIRAAGGIFYDQIIAGENNPTASTPPFVAKGTCGPCPGPLSNPLGAAPPLNPVPTPAGSGYIFPYGDYQLPGHYLKTPYTASWNFTVEHQVGPNTLLRASYVGNEASHLFDSMQSNIPVYIPGQSTGANENQRRPIPNIRSLQLDQSVGTSNYQALQFTTQQRFSHSFSVLANYTWSKAIDTASQPTEVVCPENLRSCRGPSDYDVPQRLVVSGIFEHPRLTSWNSFARAVLGGWQSNLIFTAQSGAPFTVFCNDDNSLTGIGSDRCDRVPGVPVYPANQTLGEWYNPAAFQANAVGTFGNEGRNTLRGPKYVNMDYSLFKTFPIAERLRLQLRGEAFNVFNHPNFLNPSNNLFANPGLITGANPPRIIQIAAKIIF